MQIEVNKVTPICPSEGYYEVDEVNGSCATTFIKCSKSTGENQVMEGYVYQCPEGYAYWSISKRCERTSRLLQCRGIDVFRSRWEIPIETVNVSLKRDTSSLVSANLV